MKAFLLALVMMTSACASSPQPNTGASSPPAIFTEEGQTARDIGRVFGAILSIPFSGAAGR